MIAPSLQMPRGSIASIAALGERKQPTFQALFVAPRKGIVCIATPSHGSGSSSLPLVLGLHHANRTMKKSTRIFRDSTHKCLTGIDPVPVAPDAVLLNEPFFD